MSKYDWLLFIHVTGAFLLGGGVVAFVAFNVTAQLRQRPSEIALLLRLTQAAAVPIISGALLTLVFGLWLVSASPYGYGFGQGWVIAAIALWVAGNVLGETGAKRDRKTHELAVRLAAEGDAPNAALKARLRDPLTLFLSYGAGLVMLTILAVMVWKPGA